MSECHHLLVTNDYPPKVGGIQNYLWELYRRLDPEHMTVLTRPHPGWRAFDAAQDHEIVRPRQPVLVPEPWLARKINSIARTRKSSLVMYDPAIPVGLLGPRLRHPYGVILHGAEVTIPGRIPVSSRLLGEVLRKAELVITAGEYSTGEAERAAGRELPVAIVPPGVDTERFVPLTASERRATRRSYGLDDDALVILTLSRLVPRKGIDVLIAATAQLHAEFPKLELLVAGSGRDRSRLERLADDQRVPVRFLGRVPDEHVPALYGLADVFAMLCRNRWGGLEQEGFGIVFLEAAATGVVGVAGSSGGAAEAVSDGESGVVVRDPRDVRETIGVLRALLSDPERRAAMGVAARQRAQKGFSYDHLAREYEQVVSQTVARVQRAAGDMTSSRS